jgi:arylsulfatase A-like enzyme
MWSDHGWHLGEKHHWRKFTLWEEAARAPVMFVVPGMTKPRQRCERTISYVDFYPTLTGLCGLPMPDGLDGRSLVPLLKDPQTPWDHPAVTTHGRNRHGLRSERYRYIRYNDGTEELYDHQNDPMEWLNLADKPAFEAIKRELAGHLPKKNAPSAPMDPKRRPARKAAHKKN